MAVCGVQGQWMGLLEIDGRPVYIDLIDCFHEITVRSHIHMDLPSLTLSFRDKGNVMINELGMRDGMKAVVGLGDGRGRLRRTSEYLFTGNPQVAPAAGAYDVLQKGQLNNPAWNKAIWDKHVEGKSGDVVKQLASKAGLRAIVDTTDDKMKWLPNNRTLSSYARFVTERSFAGQGTAIMTGITERGTYLFKDIEKIQSGGRAATIGRGAGEINYIEHMFTSKGKIYNAVRGYGSTTAQDLGDGLLKEFNKIGGGFGADGIRSIGSAFSAAAGALGVRVEFSPIDCGNTHKNYREARHQNARVKGTYSEDVKVMFDIETDLELLQKVQFNPIDLVTGAPIPNYTGEYIVSGVMRTLQHSRYWEVVTLTSQG